MFTSPGLTFKFKCPSIKRPPALKDHILDFSLVLFQY